MYAVPFIEIPTVIAFVIIATLGATHMIPHNYSTGSGPIFLNQVACNDDDTQLLECHRLQQLGLAQCDHSTDTMVHCEGSNTVVIGSSKLKCTPVHHPSRKFCIKIIWLRYITRGLQRRHTPHCLNTSCWQS